MCRERNVKTKLAAVVLTASALTAVAAAPASAHTAGHHKVHHASCTGLTIALITKNICIPL